MGRVDHNRIDEGDAIVETDLNTTLSSWNTESGDIDGDNVRMEGLDRRVFPAEMVVPLPLTTGGNNHTFTDPGPTTLNIASFSIIQMGGSNVSIGAFTYATSQAGSLLVTLSFDYSGTKTTTAAKNAVYAVSLFYSTAGSGGPWTQILSTMRRFQFGNDWWGIRGRCTIVHHFVTAVTTTNLWFAVGVQESNGSPTQDFVIRDLNLFAKDYDL